MALFASDIDGTLDADPTVMGAILAALHQAGHTIAILTGVHGAETITPADVQAKRSYLAELGIDCYDQLIVFPDDGNLPQAKAAWCKTHGAAALFDNNRGNAEAASDCCLVLVPWATRMGKAKDGRS